jgi:predicted small lipoprotein YifL
VSVRPLLLLCATALLAGCGQKGPLYLPDKNTRVITTPATPPAAPVPASKEPPADAAPQPAPQKQPGDPGDDSQPPR